MNTYDYLYKEIYIIHKSFSICVIFLSLMNGRWFDISFKLTHSEQFYYSCLEATTFSPN